MRLLAMAAAAVLVLVAGLMWSLRDGADAPAPNASATAKEDVQLRADDTRRPLPRGSTRRGETSTSLSDSSSEPRPPRLRWTPPPGSVKPAHEIDAQFLRPVDQALKNQKIPPKFQSLADRAFESYRRKENDHARKIAIKLLTQLENNATLRRLAVATSCRLNDPEAAKIHVERLPSFDQAAMRSLCSKHGVAISP